MANDNVVLNPGTGGQTLRTFAESTGVEWPAAVVSYVTTLAAGANVVTPVAQGTPLPVEATLTGSIVVASVTADVPVVSDDPANFLCTATIAAGQTIAATQSGTWNVGTVASISSPVAVTQSGTWNVGTVATITNPVTVNVAAAQTLANVTTVGTITNAVTVTQSTAANLKATVDIASGQTIATVTNVGTVATITNPIAATQSGAWNAGISAGTNLIGKASVGQDTSTIYSGTTAITPKFAVITASTSGDTEVIAAVVGKKIRVLRWSVTASGAVNVSLKSSTTSQISGVKYLIASASGGGAYAPVGICETVSGEALNINLSADVSVSGELTYIEV